MKAAEFIKKFGWGEAKSFVNKTNELYGCITDLHHASNGYISVLVPHLVRDFDTSIKDLKSYVDAYELVQKFGGLIEAKKCIDDKIYPELGRAITLVEEVGGCDE